MSIDESTRFDVRSLTAKRPRSWRLGDDIDWDAPLIDALITTELPFWLMLKNGSLAVQYKGYSFPITWHDDWFELHVYEMADSRTNCVYRGIRRQLHEMNETIQEFVEATGGQFVWRKCKTVVGLRSKVNSSVVSSPPPVPKSFEFYLQELCRSHIPIINKLIAAYRLQSYDYFAHEVSPWDVPYWRVTGSFEGCCTCILPYKEWDGRPVQIFADKPPEKQHYLPTPELHMGLDFDASPGEYDLMDAMNLTERGDYAGALRRVTSAVEVILEERLSAMISNKENGPAAAKFLKRTRNDFRARANRWCDLRGDTSKSGQLDRFEKVRSLRHEVVHRDRRILPSEKYTIQMYVDTSRWLYNAIEADPARTARRESSVGLRSLGRAIHEGAFRSEVTADGIVISRIPPNRG